MVSAMACASSTCCALMSTIRSSQRNSLRGWSASTHLKSRLAANHILSIPPECPWSLSVCRRESSGYCLLSGPLSVFGSVAGEAAPQAFLQTDQGAIAQLGSGLGDVRLAVTHIPGTRLRMQRRHVRPQQSVD